MNLMRLEIDESVYEDEDGDPVFEVDLKIQTADPAKVHRIRRFAAELLEGRASLAPVTDHPSR